MPDFCAVYSKISFLHQSKPENYQNEQGADKSGPQHFKLPAPRGLEERDYEVQRARRKADEKHKQYHTVPRLIGRLPPHLHGCFKSFIPKPTQPGEKELNFVHIPAPSLFLSESIAVKGRFFNLFEAAALLSLLQKNIFWHIMIS